ncbi:outer membrane lipoprotein-sorting protein [Paenibacillus sp. y28]|uniref:outer membrane lipoprotein-sorting protein n=1 Tax=Paenibacillus sp. y28 TaxID=3129110 RepID=UPI0030188AEF
MKRLTWLLLVVMVVGTVLAGCGKKSADDVVNALDGVVGKMESYSAVGRMTLQTGQEPQEYGVEVWYQKPHYYRIALTSEQKDITQIVLRNDDGVFVLTPHLNKMFRFQSDWPENSGQVYLYQSLVQSILLDSERQFTVDQDKYVFDVAANYQHGMLARQKIWLDRKTYAPSHVEVSDDQAQVVVKVDFTDFQFGRKFDQDSFDMERNMTSSRLQMLPAMAAAGVEPVQAEAGNAAAGGTGAGAAGTAAAGAQAANSQTAASAAGGASAGTQAGGKATAPSAGGSSQSAVNGQAGKDTAAGAAAGAMGGLQTGGSGGIQGTGAAAGAQNAASSGVAPGQSIGVGTNPPSAAGIGAGAAAGAVSGSKAAAAGASAAQQGFGVIDPAYIPSGVKQAQISDIKFGEGSGVLLRYSGKYNYSLLESRPKDRMVMSQYGEGVDLGYTVGVLTGEEQKTLVWTFDGVEYRLSSSDLPIREMIKVAQSVQGQVGK